MSLRSLPARALPYLLAAVLLATALGPRSLNPSIVTLGGLLLGGTAAAVAGLTGRRVVSRDAGILAGIALATAAWFAVVATRATSPMVSLFGIPGQHNAASLWVITAVWLTYGLLCADSRTLRETIAVVSGSGVFFASAALYETLSVGAQRAQGYAAGLFENSTSAGEMFGIAIIASATGAVITSKRPLKIAYVAAGLACVAGLVQSSSRTGWLGLSIAAIFAFAVYRIPASGRHPWVFGISTSVTALAGTAVGVAASTGALGAGAQSAVYALGTQRDVIWRAALAQFAQSPVIGQGLEQFSTLITWGVAGGVVKYQGTSDPHSILLAAAVGGGAIGLVLVLALFSALLGQNAAIARLGTRSTAGALLASVPAFVVGSGLVGWISPAAALSMAALAGAMCGAAESRMESPVRSKAGNAAASNRGRLLRSATLIASAGTLALTVSSIVPFTVGRTYVTSRLAGATPLSVEQSAALYKAYPDPRIAADALDALIPAIQAGSTQAATQAVTLLGASEKDTASSSLLAVPQLVVAQALEAKDASAFPRFERIAAAAAHGDPTTGAWYAFAALEAGRLGYRDRSVEYARKALATTMSPEDRALLERVAAQ